MRPVPMSLYELPKFLRYNPKWLQKEHLKRLLKNQHNPNIKLVDNAMRDLAKLVNLIPIWNWRYIIEWTRGC